MQPEIEGGAAYREGVKSIIENMRAEGVQQLLDLIQ